VPQDHPGAKDRYRRVREAKAKAAASQAMGT
jgi:hypothetical protein